MPRAVSRLYRRSDSPYWWAVYTSPEGVVVRQSTGCRDNGAASTWLAAREIDRARADAGIPVARPVSLILATAEYLTEHEPIWSRGWYITVEGFVRVQILPHFGETRTVSSIGPSDVAAFRSAQMHRTVRGGKQVSPSTVNRIMWAMAAFGAWCVDRRYHLSNPWQIPSLPESQLPVPEVDAATVAKVLMALSARWRPVVEFALETGLRKGELGRLQWQDIDVNERRAWVVSAHGRGLTKSRKTRGVPLSRRAMEILASLPDRSGLVFGPVGDPRRAFKRAAEAAGLERVWMHLFRHLAASGMARRGASTADLVAFGGWSGSRMADRYTHTTHQRLLAVMDRGEDAGRGTLPTRKGKGRSE